MYCIIFPCRLQVWKAGKRRTSCEINVKKRETAEFFRVSLIFSVFENFSVSRPEYVRSGLECHTHFLKEFIRKFFFVQGNTDYKFDGKLFANVL